jgi:hypothetical protein
MSELPDKREIPPRGRGRPKKLPHYRPFVLRLPPELHRALLASAQRRRVSLNDLMIWLSQTWLDEEQAAQAPDKVDKQAKE